MGYRDGFAACLTEVVALVDRMEAALRSLDGDHPAVSTELKARAETARMIKLAIRSMPVPEPTEKEGQG